MLECIKQMIRMKILQNSDALFKKRTPTKLNNYDRFLRVLNDSTVERQFGSLGVFPKFF